MSEPYELADGRLVPVAAEYHGVDYTAWVLHDVEAAGEWVLTWTDGVYHWLERWSEPDVAFARLAALVYAANHDEFLVHTVDDAVQQLNFNREVTHFIARTTTRSVT